MPNKTTVFIVYRLKNGKHSNSPLSDNVRQRKTSMTDASQCQTMFCRTSGSSESSKTFGQTYPNCGTYFFKHVSDGEDDLDAGIRAKSEDSKSDPNSNILLPLSDLDSDEVSDLRYLRFYHPKVRV